MADPIRELLSQTSYDTDGTTTVWNFSFAGGYIERAHVNVQIMDKATLAITQIPITNANFIGDFQLELLPAFEIGYELTIYRDSPKDLPIVDFADRAALTEAALDLNARQAIFVAAESSDMLSTSLEAVSQVTAQVEFAQGFAEDSSASATDSANSAADAAHQVTLAVAQVVLAADQVALAADQVDLAADQVALAAAQVALAEGHANDAAQSAVEAAASAASVDTAYLRNRANHTGTQEASTVSVSGTPLPTILGQKADTTAVNAALALKADTTALTAGLALKVDKAGGTMTGNLNVPRINSGQIAGVRNRLIDGGERVNQSDFNGNWSALAVNSFGYDIWKKLSSTTKGQTLEEGSFKPGLVHTLSGTGVTTSQITSPASGNWVVSVPLAATNVMLEEGTVASTFELIDVSLETLRVRRYFEVTYAGGVSYAASGTSVQRVAASWAIPKRAIPTITLGVAGGTGTSPVVAFSGIYGALFGFGSTAPSQDIWLRVTADSRL